MSKVSLQKIEEELSSLPPTEQLRLMERLIHRMRKTKRKDVTSWDELYGLGKGVWDGQDAQEYVDEIREDRQ